MTSQKPQRDDVYTRMVENGFAYDWMSAFISSHWNGRDRSKYEGSPEEIRKACEVGEEEEAGASINHCLINTNVVCELKQQLEGEGKSCFVFSNDLYVKTANKCYLPDVVVACGILRVDRCNSRDENREAIKNPIVIFEILSGSTAKKDQGEKFEEYKTLDSFREYVLIEQEPYSVFFFWKENDVWSEPRHFTDISDSISLVSIDCVLPLSKIYHKIEQLRYE